MILTLILILLLTFGSDAYLSLVVLKHLPLWVKLLVWVPSIVFFGCFFMAVRGNWGMPVNLLIGILVCILIPKTIFCLIHLIGSVCGIAYTPITQIFNIIGGAIAAVICVCGIYGVLFGWKHLVVTDVEVTSASLPAAFEGYKIAQISDLHLGTFGDDDAYIKKLVEKINSLNPDLIVFTGDIVNFTYKEVAPFKQELSRLHARDGVLSILGNHDYALYAGSRTAEQSQRLVDTLITTEREMHWRLLLDENVEVHRGNDTIWIAGVQNIGKHFSANKGDLDKALAGIPDGAFTILLSHDPSHWEEAVSGKRDVQLTLSGHTHGMQFKIAGWSPSSFVFRYWGGHYIENTQHLNVSTGAGGNLPFRFGVWPEIALITLKR